MIYTCLTGYHAVKSLCKERKDWCLFLLLGCRSGKTNITTHWMNYLNQNSVKVEYDRYTYKASPQVCNVNASCFILSIFVRGMWLWCFYFFIIRLREIVVSLSPVVWLFQGFWYWGAAWRKWLCERVITNIRLGDLTPPPPLPPPPLPEYLPCNTISTVKHRFADIHLIRTVVFVPT